MTLTRTLVEHVLANARHPLPEPAMRAAGASLIDAVSVMLAATGLEPAARPFRDHALAVGGAAEARFLGSGGRRVPAASAALVNGALAHALDFEDTFDEAGGHPNAVVIPAALALGEAFGASGGEVLAAIATGADMTCRLGLGLARDPAGAGWYHPPMLSALGAVFGVARMRLLTADQAFDALSLVMTGFSLSAELKRSPHSTLRAVRDGLAAKAVVEAVQLARAGVRGFALPLEGKAGFYRQYSGEAPNEDRILDGLGSRYLNTILSIKDWPTCRGTHAAIAIARRMRADGLTPDAIDRIAVTVTSPDEMLMRPIDQKRAPATVIDAKFSIPFAASAMLEDGAVSLATFLDIAPRPLAARFDDAGSFGARPDLQGLTVFDCRLVDGTTRRYDHRRPDGATTGTVTRAAQRAKFDGCVVHAAPAIGALAADRLFDALTAFGDRPASALFDALG